MKNLLLSTALVLSTATFAGAASHSQIAMQVDNELATMSMNVDIDSLTEEQVAELFSALTSAETAQDKQLAVEGVLNDENVMFEREQDADVVVVVDGADTMVPRSQLRAAVLESGDDLGLTDTRIRLLDDDKLGALFLLANGNDPDKMTKAQAIVQ